MDNSNKNTDDKKLSAIQDNWIIEKQYKLNRINLNLSLQEMRFLAIYMARINSRDASTQTVCFTVDDFVRTFNIKGRIDRTYIDNIAYGLFRKEIVIPVPEMNGIFHHRLFKSCYSYKRDGKLMIEMTADEDALRLFFFDANSNHHYFSYYLRNVINLKSIYAFRLYEILKQREKMKYAPEFMVDEFREQLGLTANKYSRWRDFRKYVLDPSVAAINEHTDILCSYRCGKALDRGVWQTIVFDIQSNPKFKFGSSKTVVPAGILPVENVETNPKEQYSEMVQCMAEMCDNDFSLSELQIIADLLTEQIPACGNEADLARWNLFNAKYHEFRLREQNTTINNRFQYFKKMFL